MRVIVQKYGGSSLAKPEFIDRVAERVISTKNMGYEVVVVVSAIGETTDQLIELAKQITKNPPRRELDMLLSVGERVSIALLAMAITERGYPAISFTGSQVGIITTTDHTRARILEIKGNRIRKELQDGKIVIVAGYQGVSVEKEITTLGRGGSDTTAVALAAALNAERCEIMTDVDGVYTANPQVVPNAQRISEITYDEMLDMADLGAQVLKASAVEFAKRHNIKIYVGSSSTGYIGTIITHGKLDKQRVTGVAVDENVVLISLNHSTKQSYFSIIKSLAEEGVATKFIGKSGKSCFFILKDEDLETAKSIIESHKRKRANILMSLNQDIGLLSVIGVGINFGTDIMAKMMKIFDAMSVFPETYNFSETRLSFGIKKQHLKEVASTIHDTLIIHSNYAKV
ncbi:MAG: aspartate kinase [bacterium]